MNVGQDQHSENQYKLNLREILFGDIEAFTQLNIIAFQCWYCFDNDLHLYKIVAKTALTNGAIWDEFSEQNQKHPIQYLFSLIWCKKDANLMHILVW